MAIEFDVFGLRVVVERTTAGWRLLYPGEEGKRRVAHDVVIPPDTPEHALARYLADLFHERASPRHPEVRRLS